MEIARRAIYELVDFIRELEDRMLPVMKEVGVKQCIIDLIGEKVEIKSHIAERYGLRKGC